MQNRLFFIVSITNDQKLLSYYIIILENEVQHYSEQNKEIMMGGFMVDSVLTSFLDDCYPG